MGNAKKRSGSVASMLPVLLACSFTASFGQSMMNVALPELAERFGLTEDFIRRAAYVYRCEEAE